MVINSDWLTRLSKGIVMLRRLRFYLLVGLFQLAMVQMLMAQAAELPAQLQTPQQKAGYGIGMSIGNDFTRGGLDATTIDLDAVLLGIKDALESKKPRLEQADVQQAMQQVQQMARSKVEAKMKQLAEKNRVAGPQFMERYKAVDGVQSLKNGVLYKSLKSGNGPTPKATDSVKTHYRGRLVDGTEFDSSYKRGEPAVFPVNGVIKGWTEALTNMKVGDKWQIVIPSEMAYGANGSPPVIGPDSVLVFEIELLGIEPPQPGQ